MNNNQLELENVKNNIIAGKVQLTIKSTVTGRHFTYLITKCKNNDVWFVKVLTGDDPTDENNYEYIGFIKYDFFNFGKDKSKIGIDAKSVQAFMYAFKIVLAEVIDDRVEFYCSSNFGTSGKLLSTYESLEIARRRNE